MRAQHVRGREILDAGFRMPCDDLDGTAHGSAHQRFRGQQGRFIDLTQNADPVRGRCIHQNGFRPQRGRDTDHGEPAAPVRQFDAALFAHQRDVLLIDREGQGLLVFRCLDGIVCKWRQRR